MEYRVTKYDPAKRNAEGHYPPDEWTSVCDIGRSFGGHILTFEHYRRVEGSYVAAVASLLKAGDCDSLVITDLEPIREYDHLPTDLVAESMQASDDLWEGKRLTGNQIELCVRLVLREVVWCKLVSDRGVFLHFGYDYYMYCGGIDLTHWEPPRGIYCESCRSPYS